MKKFEIMHGDCLDHLFWMDDNSVDAVVTDPPYGWRFMGKAWDSFDIEKVAKDKERGGLMADGRIRKPRDLPAESAGTYDQTIKGNHAFQVFTESYAKELFRVLKPGGHMLVFCGPRTYHRMASGVEDAGFEIRDQLQWNFGSGFPKSHSVYKALKKDGLACECENPERCMPEANNEMALLDKKTKTCDMQSQMPGHIETERSEISTASKSNRKPGVVSKQSGPQTCRSCGKTICNGIGTALKPANEPIVLARKPLEKGLTVAQNVLKWGVGGLNIDASRIATDMNDPNQRFNETISGGFQNEYVGGDKKGPLTKPHGAPLQGRWPANLILDETAAEMLDAQSGVSKSNIRKIKDGERMRASTNHGQNEFSRVEGGQNDSGGASRFFYVAKASKRERNAGLEGANHHPTVKPIRLMEYLIRLISPPGGIVLDPFMGSGSTGVAAFRLGFKFIGIEMSEEYCEIARRRIGGA